MCQRLRITFRSETKPLPLSGRRRWVVVCSKVGPSVQKTLTDSPDEDGDKRSCLSKRNDDYNDNNNNDTTQGKQ